MSPEDVVQDVFVALWKSNEDLDPVQSVSQYLFRAAKNKALEHIRSQKSYESAVATALERMSDASEMSAETDKYVQFEKLYSLVRHLPAKCQNVFVLHKFNGLTYSEIAETESISIKTVENHMLKALKYLRENLKDANESR